MQERNGVQLGQRVRDLDGTSLGRVTRLYESGFAVQRGPAILFRRDLVVGYDEVRGVRDGDLVIARSPRDLFELAAGRVPPSWRIPAPPDFPTAATPAEARYVREDLARGFIGGEGAGPGPGPGPGRPGPGLETPVSDAEVRAHVATRGQGTPAHGSDRP